MKHTLKILFLKMFLYAATITMFVFLSAFISWITNDWYPEMGLFAGLGLLVIWLNVAEHVEEKWNQ